MRSKSSFKEESSIGSICSANADLTWRLFLMTREFIVGAAAEQAVMMNLPRRRVWPTAKAPPIVVLPLKTRQDILPFGDDTEELSMKAPMSVSKPADLR